MTQGAMFTWAAQAQLPTIIPQLPTIIPQLSTIIPRVPLAEPLKTSGLGTGASVTRQGHCSEAVRVGEH